MIEGFDKEMDFLLRQAAQGEAVFSSANPKSAHLDADEISAFAENVLPKKIRQNYVLHLADCERCRKNLVSVMQSNDAAESEIIHAEKPSPISNAIAPKIPWYQKLFAVPKLAYAMGALILILASVGIFTVLQNDSRDAEVSQTSEKQIGGGKGMSSDGDAATQETFSRSMSNTSSMNSAATTNPAAKINPSSNSMATNLPNPAVMENSNVAMQREASRASSEPERLAKPSASSNQPTETTTADSVASGAVSPAPVKAENNYQIDGQEQMSKPTPAQNQTVQNQTQIMPDARSVQRAPLPSPKMQRKTGGSLEEEPKDDKEKSAETTNVGGKKFTRNGNIWVDAAYRGQTTTNISRGTNDYKKLDAGLRGIAENLGGTVIIVWKGKAYRIQ